MRRRALVVVGLIACLSGCAGPRHGRFLQTEVERPMAIAPASSKLPVGERLTYSVRWFGIPVGTIVLSVEPAQMVEGSPVVPVMAVARSSAFLSKLYRVDDLFVSSVDPEQLVPRRLLLHRREGRYRADELMEFDHVRASARYTSWLNHTVKEIPIPPGVQDGLSGLYYVRTQPLQQGRPLAFAANVDEKNWDVEVHLVETGVMELRGLGTWEALLVEPRVSRDGEPFRKGELLVYLSADARRIPLLAQIRVHLPFVRQVVLALETIENH